MSTNILIGSHREPLPGARAVGKSNPAERLEVTVLVRRQNTDAFKAKVAGLAAGEPSAGHMKHADIAKQFGAAPADMDAVTSFAKRHDLAVVQRDAARRAVVLSGTVAQFNQAFGVDLQQFEFNGGSYRGRTGPIALPNELNGIVDAVLGLDDRPQAQPHFRSRGTNQAGPAGTFIPTALASALRLPRWHRQGQCIAIIELGGGYQARGPEELFLGNQCRLTEGLRSLGRSWQEPCPPGIRMVPMAR